MYYVLLNTLKYVGKQMHYIILIQNYFRFKTIITHQVKHINCYSIYKHIQDFKVINNHILISYYNKLHALNLESLHIYQ